jgi:uncharacterized protein (TIGR02147 family)
VGDEVSEVSALLTEAAARLKKNAPGMSVRGVAGRLDITPSYWSKILRGKKPLPPPLIPKIAKVLGLDTLQLAHLQRSILATIERTELTPLTGVRTSRKGKRSPTQDYRNMTRDELWIIEEWFYIPILNLCTVSGFQATVATLAERLGLQPAQVSDAVIRMKHLGYLQASGNGVLSRTSEKIRFPTGRSLASVRRYHDRMIQKARENLRQASDEAFASRSITSVCFAGSSAKLNEARVIMEEAMYRVANLMADSADTDEVYQMNLQIFPLTRPCPG